MGNGNNPLAICLVEIPLKPEKYLFTGKEPNPVHTWDKRTGILPHATREAQELDLLGSSRATYCINFFYWQTIFQAPKLITLQRCFLNK